MMTLPGIDAVLHTIEQAYAPEGKLHHLLTRICENIRRTCGATLPQMRDMTAQVLCAFLYEKHQEGVLQVGMQGQLELGSENIINPACTVYGALVAGRTNIAISSEGATTIAPGSFLRDCSILDSTIDGCIIEGGYHSKIMRSRMEAGSVLFGGAKIRDSHIGENNEIGTIEIVRSTTGKDLKALHRGFLGDSTLGDTINLSNFASVMNSSPDGSKASTTIGNNVFLGGSSTIVSGTQGIRIGDGAIVAAGAVVLCDIPAHHTYIHKHRIYDHTLRQPRIIPPGDTALIDIDLSVRLFNFLRSNDIHALGELKARYTEVLQKYGCGKKMQEEIERLLQ